MSLVQRKKYPRSGEPGPDRAKNTPRSAMLMKTTTGLELTAGLRLMDHRGWAA